MFGLFGRKPQPKPQPDDETMSKLSTMISDLLSVQLMILPSPRIEDERGKIFPKSIGYVYGYTDAFLTATGYNMSDLEVGPRSHSMYSENYSISVPMMPKGILSS